MKQPETLLQEDADRLLAEPKVIVDKGKAISVYTLDFSLARDFRINLSPSDSIEKGNDFLLRIRISNKLRTKISLHTQESLTTACLFRIDMNGPMHTNPAAVTETLPERFKPFAGQVIDGNHIHYHVQGYPSAAWAIPIDEDPFPVKRLTNKDYAQNLKDILFAMSNSIHLESKIAFEGNFMYDGMD